MKSGTTSLFHYVQAHPQAHMSPRKEVEFSVEEKNWRRGFDWYQARGSPAGVPGRSRVDRGGVDAYVSGTARFTEPKPAAAR